MNNSDDERPGGALEGEQQQPEGPQLPPLPQMPPLGQPSEPPRSQSPEAQPPQAPQPYQPPRLAPSAAGPKPAPPPPPPGYPPGQTYRMPAAAGGQPPRRRPGALTALWVVLVLFVLAAVTVAVGAYLASELGGGGGSAAMGSGDAVGVIPVMGIIQDGGSGSLLTGPPGSRGIAESLRGAAKDNSIKAVVLLINSPGGSAAASWAINKEVTKLRKRKKVVACMADVAASGGYYVAVAADKIVAQPATMTGSIGVIFGSVSYYGLLQKLGVQDATQTSGKYKDTGSPLRPMRPDEKDLIQAMLKDVYGQFVQAVAEGRKMDPQKVRTLADGRVYTGNQALKVGLIDQLGDFQDAIKLAATLGGIEGEPRLREFGKPKGLLAELTEAHSSMGPLQRLEGAGLAAQVQPLYGPLVIAPYWYNSVAPACAGTSVEIK